MFGPAGLFPGDHLVNLDHCLVRDKSSWRSCLYKTAKQAQTDFCLPATFLNGKTQKALDVPCCSAEMSSHLCFTGKDLSRSLPFFQGSHSHNYAEVFFSGFLQQDKPTNVQFSCRVGKRGLFCSEIIFQASIFVCESYF